MKSKVWVLTVIGVVFILAIIIVIFNYTVDSFHLFSKNNNSVINDLKKDYYISGENIAVNRVKNIYSDLIKESDNIDVLAIGSSRTMLLYKKYLFGKSVKLKYYNFTSGTARLTHYSRIMSEFNKHKKPLPKNIILGLDPWVFDEKVSLVEFKDKIKGTGQQNSTIYKELFNYEYTKINIRNITSKFKKDSLSIQYNHYKKSKKLEELLSNTNKNMIISPTGTLHYPLEKNTVTSDALDEKIKYKIQKCSQKNYNTKCLIYKDLHNFDVVLYFINYLKSFGVNVIVYLAPFEPTYYKFIQNNYQFDTHYNKILEFLRNNDIKTIGSYNPNDLGLSSNDFLDTIHTSEKAVGKIFANQNIMKLIEIEKYE